jgi:hypothetical protein
LKEANHEAPATSSERPSGAMLLGWAGGGRREEARQADWPEGVVDLTMMPMQSKQQSKQASRERQSKQGYAARRGAEQERANGRGSRAAGAEKRRRAAASIG